MKKINLLLLLIIGISTIAGLVLIGLSNSSLIKLISMLTLAVEYIIVGIVEFNENK